jgi:hypothetical protein
MANLKVITNPAYRNYPTQPREQWYLYEVREDEGSYATSTDELLEKMKVLLSKPLWPEFPDGLYLNSNEASRLYRLTHGAQGLIHILNQSTNLRKVAADYEGEPNLGLNEFLESQVWAALVEIGRGLVSFDIETKGNLSATS